MQGGAYANATWVVGVAKCGVEEGCEMIGGSSHHRADRPDRGAGADPRRRAGGGPLRPRSGPGYKRSTFNFALHRQPEHYRLIVERKGAEDPV